MNINILYVEDNGEKMILTEANGKARVFGGGIADDWCGVDLNTDDALAQMRGLPYDDLNIDLRSSFSELFNFNDTVRRTYDACELVVTLDGTALFDAQEIARDLYDSGWRTTDKAGITANCKDLSVEETAEVLGLLAGMEDCAKSVRQFFKDDVRGGERIHHILCGFG